MGVASLCGLYSLILSYSTSSSARHGTVLRFRLRWGPTSRPPTKPRLRPMREQLRPVPHHTAVEHCWWCQCANSIEANPGLTKADVASSRATSIQLEGSMNSRNSSDLGSPSASRSTLRHATPQQPWIPTPRSPGVFSLTQAA